jgi:hypothetical protein
MDRRANFRNLEDSIPSVRELARERALERSEREGGGDGGQG